MPKEIFIHVEQDGHRVAILEDGRLEDFHLEIDRQNVILGNIYKGRVETVMPSINGAFVNIGQEKNGFLYLTDTVNPLVEEEVPASQNILTKIFNRKKGAKRQKGDKEKALSKGQEILVQVVKEPFGTKGARLTTHISLPGRFVVFMPYNKQLGVSKKIENQEERQRLRELLSDMKVGHHSGFILRTAALKKGKREIIRESKFLFNLWQKIKKMSDQNQAPFLIYKEYDLLWRIVRDFLTEDVERVIIDSQEEYLRVRKFVNTIIGREMVNKINHYKGNVPLFDAQNIAHELDKIYNSKVFLKTGAYIVIEATEGVSVVDVNSGKFKTNASPEEAAFLVNMEAAPEIARQLRLRDIGGIIVIDFIDMTKESHKRQVLDALRKALTKDHAKTEVSRFSPLGLVEMTRARTGKTFESISSGVCPYCQGRGRVRID